MPLPTAAEVCDISTNALVTLPQEQLSISTLYSLVDKLEGAGHTVSKNNIQALLVPQQDPISSMHTDHRHASSISAAQDLAMLSQALHRQAQIYMFDGPPDTFLSLSRTKATLSHFLIRKSAATTRPPKRKRKQKVKAKKETRMKKTNHLLTSTRSALARELLVQPSRSNSEESHTSVESKESGDELATRRPRTRHLQKRHLNERPKKALAVSRD